VGERLILSIDVGSSSIRAGLFDNDGAPAEGLSSSCVHTLRLTPDGGSETDAEKLFELLVACVDNALARRAGSGAEVRGRPVDAVAFSTFWHSLLGVSRDGRPETALTTWADSRSAAQAERLASDLDEEGTRTRTGCVFNPSYFPARLLRYRETDPHLFQRADWWCSFGEYCYERLFGKRLCSISMASGSGLFDQDRCAWDEPILRYLGVDERTLSVLGDLDAPLTGLRAPFSGRWPELRSVPWFPAVGDGACSNIGCGCAGPASVAVMVGTSGAVRAVVPSGSLPPLPRGLWRYRVDRRRLLTGGVLGNGGNVFEWMRSTLSLPADLSALDSVLLEREAGAHGLTVLPFFTGERSVGWKPRARAVVAGMSLDTSPLDILQAGMEAVAYRFAAVQELLGSLLGPASRTVATGGALMRSRAWTQIIADVLGRPLTLSRVQEASSRGAALLALEVLGLIRDVADAPPLLGDLLTPREDRRAAHRAAAERQEKLSRLLNGF